MFVSTPKQHQQQYTSWTKYILILILYSKETPHFYIIFQSTI